VSMQAISNVPNIINAMPSILLGLFGGSCVGIPPLINDV
jgi:hypothetical protein